MYDEIMMLVINTGIGMTVYTILDIFKPLIRNIFNSDAVQWLLKWLNAQFGLTNDTAYSTVLKVLVFVIGYCVARFEGADGDLFVLLGKTTEPSIWGYLFMAAIVASGDLTIDTISQIKKGDNDNDNIEPPF